MMNSSNVIVFYLCYWAYFEILHTIVYMLSNSRSMPVSSYFCFIKHGSIKLVFYLCAVASSFLIHCGSQPYGTKLMKSSLSYSIRPSWYTKSMLSWLSTNKELLETFDVSIEENREFLKSARVTEDCRWLSDSSQILLCSLYLKVGLRLCFNFLLDIFYPTLEPRC